MKGILQICSIIVFVFFLNGCAEHDETAEAESPNLGKAEIYLSADMISRAGIKFGRIEKRTMAMEINARGQIELLPENKAVISVFYGGVIRSINVVSGQKVDKGSLLATYMHPDFIDKQQEYLQLKNEVDILEKSFERQKKLFDKGMNSEKEYLQIRSDYLNKELQFKTARAHLEMIGINIGELEKGKLKSEVSVLSPINGIVRNIYVSIGEFVGIDKPLFTVINNENLIIALTVFEKDIHMIKKGQKITFSVPVNQDQKFHAVVNEISGMVEENMRVIKIYARITESMVGILPGMVVTSTIHAEEKNVDVIPEAAVVLESGDKMYGFYTLDDPGAENIGLSRFYIEPGSNNQHGFMEIRETKGLPDGAQIVSNGIYYIKS
jgi:cobalt-zinc-cadmium efflux system membrane fusion protein